MTQRSNHPQTLSIVPTGATVADGLALTALVLVLITLITVLQGAGFGHV